eukprot:TRINITY_DN10296_c0_g1_i2.p1 TRINITY_DN10296_c0_g1~~TRINITY_DN10296_c0_g1_i2.p1  ORF type:complete len:161 (+),score=34.17 TRINITY_DN10296_c0_g1_i2:400-882(+)
MLAGKVPHDVSETDAQQAFAESLEFAAGVARARDMRVLIEPLSGAEGYFLTTVEQAADFIKKLPAGLQQYAGLQFDVFHVERAGGNSLQRYLKLREYVQHIQIASVPSRGDPDSGDVDYGALLPAFAEAGYCGTFGCEYVMDKPPSVALRSLQAAATSSA